MNGIINGISAPPGINGGMPAPGSRVGFVKFSHPLLTGIEIELPTYTSVGWLNSVMGIFPFDNGNVHKSIQRHLYLSIYLSI